MQRRDFVKATLAGGVTTAAVISMSTKSAAADYDGLPTGKDGFFVFIADGIYDPFAALLGPTGEDFDRDVMGRTDAGREDFRQDALDFFVAEYGADFSAGTTDSIETIPGFPPTQLPVDASGNLFLVHTQLSPLANYRAVVVGGDNAGSDGLPVWDANYAAVTRSETTLTGRWGGPAGRTVPAGSVLVFGEYLVQTRKPTPQSVGLPGYRISWTSFDPVMPLPGFSWPENRFLFDCRMFSDEFGEGVALGRNETRWLPDGTVQQLIRNVISFPADEFYANR